MTLCIAAKFPWELMAHLPGPPAIQCVLFATDSRLTIPQSWVTSDTANKLFQIDRGAGLVFAGNYLVGRKSAELLDGELRNRSISEANSIISVAHRILEYEYSRIAHDPECPSLEVLLGVFDHESEQARLIGYRSPTFQPQELGGMIVIGGGKEIQDRYKEQFHTLVRGRLSSHGVSDNPMEWLTFISLVLDAVIGTGISPYIGGIVQTAITSPQGFRWVGHSRRDPSGKWVSTERKEKHWRELEVGSGKEIGHTGDEPWQEEFYSISD